MTTIRELLKDDDKRTVSRTAFGLGVGAGLGFVVGGPAGAGIGALAGGALGALSDPGPQKGELTEAREHIFWKAMACEKAEAVKAAAELLCEAELFDYADALLKRVALLTLPDDERANREDRFLRALSAPVGKSAGVLRVAEFFRARGSLVAAAMLTEHAQDLVVVESGKADAACVARFERRLGLVRERGSSVEAKCLAYAEENLARARGVVTSVPAPCEP